MPHFTEADARTALRTLRARPRGVTVADVTQGMNVEYEHRGVTHGDPTMTARIALDHLRERPDYYRLLAWMERAPRLARNPAVPRVQRYKGGTWQTEDASLTVGHHALPGTRVAAHVAGMARTLGVRLGQGNFGEAFAVDTPHGRFVVKLPAPTNIHGQPYPTAQAVRDFRHEAGVANALARTRFAPLVPATTYADLHDGTPALVREYGTPAGPLTRADFTALEQALTELEHETGMLVHDDLQLYRRPDGALYVGDVGLWEPRPRGPTIHDPSTLGTELEVLARRLGLALPASATLPGLARSVARLRDTIQRAEAKGKEPASFLLEIAVEPMARGVAARDALGLPVPEDVRGLARRYALVVRPKKNPAARAARPTLHADLRRLDAELAAVRTAARALR